MNSKVLLFFLIVVGGSLGIVGYYFARPYLFQKEQWAFSDSARTEGAITIGVDNWVGYVPLCGKELRRNLHQAGLVLRCEDDNADYPARMERLRSGQLDFAVATVDSFILNGAKEDFPGTIIMVIDESKGGDAIVSRKDRVSKIDDLKTRSNYKIAFTPSSPSEHLLKAVSAHFDIPTLRDKNGAWRMAVSGSEEARRKLENGEVDAAVVWEPDVSRLLADKKMHKLLGTEDTRRLIVDILLVNRDFAKKAPQRVKLLLTHYFKTLRAYREQPELLAEAIRSATKLNESQSSAVQRGVRWINLTENARDWFGISVGGRSSEGLVQTIDATLEILLDQRDFAKNPLPDRDPYRLQYRAFIEELVSDKSQFGSLAPQEGKEDSKTDRKVFAELSSEQWETMTEVATLKLRPITFQSGTSELNSSGREELDATDASLGHYPNFRILVKGHTGRRGDVTANRQLSLARAESVKRYLVSRGTEVARLRAVGLGSAQPLARDPGESDRAYEYRLPRVELTLVSEAY